MSGSGRDADRASGRNDIQIFPQAPELPANVLRFYLHCQRPWEAYFDRDRLRLKNEEGRCVPDPFLVLSRELWSADGRRLTILMEPGRIKRGMGANPSHDPALRVGRRYSLEIGALGHTARFTFRVGEAVLSPLDEAHWRIAPPAAGGRDPLLVRFDRVMDTALCETEIAVLDPSGAVFPTNATLATEGTIARLVPRRAWRAGAYRLIVSSHLEDVCGNRLGEALDHDLRADGRARTGEIVFSARSCAPVPLRRSSPSCPPVGR